MLFPKVEKYPILKSKIEYLSHQYYTYKDSYMFPSKYESKTKSVLFSIHNSLQSKVDKLKSREMVRVKDEDLMMKDEGFKVLRGFAS